MSHSVLSLPEGKQQNANAHQQEPLHGLTEVHIHANAAGIAEIHKSMNTPDFGSLFNGAICYIPVKNNIRMR